MPYDIPIDFSKDTLKEIHDCFVANNNFSELKNKIVTLEELNNYPLILLAEGSNGRYFLDNICTNLKVKLTPKFELASYSLVTEFIKSGIGIGLVTKEFIEKELNNGSLFEIKLNPPIINRNIGMIHLNNKKLSRCAELFLELLNK